MAAMGRLKTGVEAAKVQVVQKEMMVNVKSAKRERSQKAT